MRLSVLIFVCFAILAYILLNHAAYVALKRSHAVAR